MHAARRFSGAASTQRRVVRLGSRDDRGRARARRCRIGTRSICGSHAVENGGACRSARPAYQTWPGRAVPLHLSGRFRRSQRRGRNGARHAEVIGRVRAQTRDRRGRAGAGKAEEQAVTDAASAEVAPGDRGIGEIWRQHLATYARQRPGKRCSATGGLRHGCRDHDLGDNIGFVAALVLGLVQLLLADHDGRVDRRDGLGLLAGFAGLLCSSVALTMIAVVGLATLARRSWRAAALIRSRWALVNAVWFPRLRGTREPQTAWVMATLTSAAPNRCVDS